MFLGSQPSSAWMQPLVKMNSSHLLFSCREEPQRPEPVAQSSHPGPLVSSTGQGKAQEKDGQNSPGKTHPLILVSVPPGVGCHHVTCLTNGYLTWSVISFLFGLPETQYQLAQHTSKAHIWRHRRGPEALEEDVPLKGTRRGGAVHSQRMGKRKGRWLLSGLPQVSLAPGDRASRQWS